MKTEKFNVGGMTCAACQANVTKCVSKIDGVAEVNVNLLAGSMTVSYDESRSDSDTIAEAVCAIGYKTESLEKNEVDSRDRKKSKTEEEWKRRTAEAAKARKNLLWRWVSSLALLPKRNISLTTPSFWPPPMPVCGSWRIRSARIPASIRRKACAFCAFFK